MDFTVSNGSGDRNESPKEITVDFGPEAADTETVGQGGAARAEQPTDGTKKPELLPNHRAELRASGLTDETGTANGVYSESDPKEVAALINWSVTRAKLLGPVLVYPHFDRDGRPLHHAAVKPDRPRDRADKPGKVKYENPRQRPNRLYVPAGARGALGEPTAPLLVTEGCKKALAATQHGFPCVSLPGVWCWVAPREKKNGKKVGKLALNHDLAGVAWKGRRVYICFDSDAASNSDVARAEKALAEVLIRHGAEVRVVRLPAEPDGAKNGLDDFLVRHGAERLRQILNATNPAANPKPEAVPIDATAFTESGYTAVRGNTFHCVLARDEDTDELVVAKKTKLANFIAKIVGETVTDDGTEQAREFAVRVEQGHKPARVAGVPVERFGALDWVVEKFGPTLVIQAGSGKRDHLRCAIQEMSGDDIPSATVYTHTGWREIGRRWCYLHGAGAIVPSVPGVPVSPSIDVRLDGAASGFQFPAPLAGDALRGAVRASLGLLDGLVPDAVAFPLVATVYRAGLGPADFALWLSGLTGAQKSELAALAQQHFGAGMTRSRLPGNWASTDNALEGLAFTVKDAVLVIDDFAPPTSRADADRQHRTAERLIRGQGNSAGRQRMRADGTLRPPKPPRGLILATGEDVPRGHSITARLGVVAVRRGDVNLARLSACQKDAADGLHAAAMAGFIAWLAPRYANVRGGLDAERVQLRDQFVGQFSHARTPDIIANLLLGLRYLLAFAGDIQAIDRPQREELWRRGEVAFRALAGQQGEHQRAADPVARFPEMLGAVLSSGRGHLAGPDGKEPGAPPSVAAWGWDARESRTGFGEARVSCQPRGRKIGWVAGEEVYLDPDSAFAALSELAHEQGQAYPVTQQTLYRRLKESGVLVRTDGDRTAYPVTLEGVRRRVLVLAADFLLGKPGQPGQPGLAKGNTGSFVPVVPVSGTGGGTESTNGRHAHADELFTNDVEVFAP
ncbi:hypothetical protein GobsT_49550 [Gemmata obscuriglobus]|uniref:DUF3854 domain-containing protein n=1 Tax=Gemmata obscuriglobus TaxID=114 RepID=A0A2Z3GWX2_9BACT|nr:DUF3854 domain-containing protein [Gemmata obscuriglobus]AWM37121.1 hypothetical protein C1280_08845 [Gemmata obscuriglobus]QEG30153.1 hypothetical protein GobsT_49550 [Gemmata obscuriglobus]VTS09474.1 DNA/RNA helicase, superfamily II OS=Thermoanaerobacterium thermosaccharolyticum M0795 GN=Thethe_02112 PE=4 SV=1: DUF3854: DUF927 [Gemmata obscuriglobus UQM 2246]